MSGRAFATQLLLDKLSLQAKGSPASSVDAMNLDPQPSAQQSPAGAQPYAASPFGLREMQGSDGPGRDSPFGAKRRGGERAPPHGQSGLGSRRSSGEKQLSRCAVIVRQVIEGSLVPQMLWKLQEDDFWIQVGPPGSASNRTACMAPAMSIINEQIEQWVQLLLACFQANCSVPAGFDVSRKPAVRSHQQDLSASAVIHCLAVIHSSSSIPLA